MGDPGYSKNALTWAITLAELLVWVIAFAKSNNQYISIYRSTRKKEK